MESSGDFVELLDKDVSLEVLSHLDDPSDIVRAALVSRYWRQCVIENQFCKKLCLRLFPEVSSAIHAIEVENLIDTKEANFGGSTALETSEKNHRVYAILTRGLAPNLKADCIKVAISATSTDNYPEESIQNTLEPRDRVGERASYWSSKGESDPAVPETLTYELVSKICFITEIHIQPFQAYFQYGFPIYSAKAVRFRMGHLKSPLDFESDILEEFAAGLRSPDDYISWTYVSSSFPMAQENCLQKFKLPQPVLCIGGILRVELLGRVQRQEMDNLYYLCVSHVQVVGRPLSPKFDVEVCRSGKCALKYCPDSAGCSSSVGASADEKGESSRFYSFTTRLMRRAGWNWEEMLVNNFLGNIQGAHDGMDSDEEEAL
ncbi:hypothetical protein Scep_006498 [Stephania cephalantha]|uniref:F-box domain-containing protein n=1 Tax=Stephania cephalantha TaxID=152367 RepID=A0AAP0K849_9MAGN